MSCSQQVEQVVAGSFVQGIQLTERERFVDWATLSYPALRQVPEPDCGLRTPFQRDRDRIIHSKAFRRLAHKTQVFVAPMGDHFRTRLTHTLEVTQVSRTVARALRLNEDLVEAIGLSHDLGHPPFGHIGEQILDRCLQEYCGRRFHHYEHSLRIVDYLERGGAGLNLTNQVRDGILHHSGGTLMPQTNEGAIVRLVDRIAYINHDIDDALRAGVLNESDLPSDEIAILGSSGSSRIDRLVHDLVEESNKAGEIKQGEIVGPAMLRLRKFMFQNVYLAPRAKQEQSKIQHIIQTLFDHYCNHSDQLPVESKRNDEIDVAQRVTDYVAGMTDRFCTRVFAKLTM